MKTAKKAIDIFSTVLIVLLVCLVLLLHGSKLIGIKTYAVLSGSMEPAYHTGSVVYVKSVSASELSENDVITFFDESGTVVTHRVVKLLPEEKKIVTRGDANDCDDSAVGYSSVIGKVVFTIPLLGYVAVWLSSVAGKCFVVAAFLFSVVLLLISEMFLKKENNA